MTAHLNRALLHDHPSREHYLLVDTGYLKIPGSALVSGSEGDLDAVDRHGHHDDLLDGFVVRRRRSPLRVGHCTVDMLLVQLGVGIGLRPEVGRKVERRSRRMSES